MAVDLSLQMLHFKSKVPHDGICRGVLPRPSILSMQERECVCVSTGGEGLDEGEESAIACRCEDAGFTASYDAAVLFQVLHGIRMSW